MYSQTYYVLQERLNLVQLIVLIGRRTLFDDN